MSEPQPPDAGPDGQPGGAQELRVSVTDALRALAAAVITRGPEYVDPAAVHLSAPIYAALRPGAGAGPTRPRYAGACPCLVGAALAELGVARQALAAVDLQTGCTRISHITLDGAELSDGARLVFAAAQDAQDSAAEWGHGLACAFTAATDAEMLSDTDLANLTPHITAALAVQASS